MANRFSDRARPEGDDRDAAASLVFVLVHDHLHGVGAAELVTDLHDIVLPPGFAGSVKGPHPVCRSLLIAKGSVEDGPRHNNALTGKIASPETVLQRAGERR